MGVEQEQNQTAFQEDYSWVPVMDYGARAML